MATLLTRLRTVPTIRDLANYVELRLRRGPSLVFLPQSVLDPEAVRNVRLGLSDSDHYGVNYMP